VELSRRAGVGIVAKRFRKDITIDVFKRRTKVISYQVFRCWVRNTRRWAIRLECEFGF